MRFLIVKDLIAAPQRQRATDRIFDILNIFSKVYIVSFEELINFARKGDIIFNLAIGQRHDFLQGNIAAFAEMFGYEHVGSPPYTHYLCLDKFVTKSMLKSYDIKTSDGILFDGKNFIGEFPVPPFMVKPVAEGSGIGVDQGSFCLSVKEAQQKAKEKFALYKESILVENFLDGPEVTVGIIGYAKDKFVLPELEIDFSNLPDGIERYYSQRVKENFDENMSYRCPSSFNEKIKESIKETALKVFEIFKARDYLRIDMRIVNDIPYVIEANSMPGLDPQTSDLPKMIKPINKDYGWLVKAIVKRAINAIGG